MCHEDLLYIEDDDQRKLYYHFTPGGVTSNFVPLIVILDDESEVSNFEYKMWNVLRPIDHFGDDNKGSCWLGEKGDFFVKELLQKLIHTIAQEYECEDHIYLYGNAIGGYSAILHGILCNANAVYAHAALIKLPNADSAVGEMKALFTSVFDKTVSKENDLTHFLNSNDRFPIFYLCDDSIAEGNGPEDETAYFADACKKHDINVHLDFCKKRQEDRTHVLKEVLNFFERVASEK